MNPSRPLWSSISFLKYCSSSSSTANVLKIGDSLKQSRVFTCSDITDYSKLTHDHNPLHFDRQHAKSAGFEDVIVPGILVASLFPNIIAFHFPGAVYLKQTLDFKSPAFVEDKIMGEVQVSNIRQLKEKYMVKFATTCFKDGEIVVICGEAVAILPTLAIKQP